MSQTWIIKDTAPVDEASYVLTETDISFTSGGEKFTKILIHNDGGIGAISLVYRSDGTVEIVATLSYVESESQFYWQPSNEKYKTLEFDTAPTGELLAWLQKNADLQDAPQLDFVFYQDIHLEDKALWNQLQTAWEQGDYTTALNVLKNASLADKQLNAATINALTTEILSLQAQSDPSFKTGQIVVASEPPSDLAVGKVYFRLIGPVTDYNEQNAYYIEINQKTSSGYDVLNPATQADNIALTENTAAKFGLVGVTYTLDKALYDVEQLLQVVTTT